MCVYIVYACSILTEYYLTEINKKILEKAKDLTGFCKSTLLYKFYPWMPQVWVSECLNHPGKPNTGHDTRLLTLIPYIRVDEWMLIAAELLISSPD